MNAPIFWSPNFIVKQNDDNKVKNIIGRDANLAQAAISFCLAFDAVSTVIPGNTNLQQLKENISGISKPISKEVVEKLEAFYQNEAKELNIPW